MKNKKLDIITEKEIHLSKTPPLPPEISEYNSIKEWLYNMCKLKGYEENIERIHFRLADPENDKRYTLWFYGSTSTGNFEIGQVNRYPINAINNKRFDEKVYYPLRENEISNLNKEQVHQKIISELQSFATTENFKHSFFAKAKSIVIDFNGQIIWESKS